MGPLLFLIFINDLPMLIKDCRLSFFADDLKIYKIIRTINDATQLQGSVTTTHNWCAKNGMLLNINKCTVISFTRCVTKIVFNYDINGTVLSRVEIIRDLGVMLDSSLTFKNHIQSICARAHQVLGFIKRRSKEFDDTYLTKTLYYSLPCTVHS